MFWVETKGLTLEEVDAIFDGAKHSSVPDVEAVRLGKEQIDVNAMDFNQYGGTDGKGTGYVDNKAEHPGTALSEI